MSGINTGKVIVGGLVAGVALNAVDFASGILLASDFAANTTRLGLDPGTLEAPATIGTWVAVDFIMGLILVFLYAAIRPRFGAGPKTATIAGIIIWLAVGIIVFGFATMGMIDMPLYWKTTIISLVNVVIAANVGAWLYKEA